MERSNFFVERSDFFVERCHLTVERSDLEQSDHGYRGITYKCDKRLASGLVCYWHFNLAGQALLVCDYLLHYSFR